MWSFVNSARYCRLENELIMRREPGNVQYPDPLIVYRVRQGFVSRNTSRNTCGCVQGEVLLVPLISCWIVEYLGPLIVSRNKG